MIQSHKIDANDQTGPNQTKILPVLLSDDSAIGRSATSILHLHYSVYYNDQGSNRVAWDVLPRRTSFL